MREVNLSSPADVNITSWRVGVAPGGCGASVTFAHFRSQNDKTFLCVQ